MHDYTNEIRSEAKRLLADDTVALVIGFRRSRQPLRNAPFFARDQADADRLVWDAGCGVNLANYLPGRRGRVAVVAKGCDIRALVALVNERQVQRDRVIIIGVPCAGMISRHKVDAFLEGRELLEAHREGDSFILRGKNVQRRVAARELLADSCVSCADREPPLCDVRIGDARPMKPAPDPYTGIREFEALTAGARYEWFTKEFSRCIRCFACRNACPACGCEQCMVDAVDPVWIGKGNDTADTLLFHIVRAFHGAGRCVDCGACRRACPMGIDLRRLTAKVRKDVEELFGADADTPALATFKPDDPEDGLWQRPVRQ
jgi:formate dehydrogenase (coenzyme F420) beta subunit